MASSATTPAKQLAETIATNTTPIPVGVSGLTWLGFTMKDWVFMGTGILLVFQLIVITPKVCTAVAKIVRAIRRRKQLKEAYGDGKCK